MRDGYLHKPPLERCSTKEIFWVVEEMSCPFRTDISHSLNVETVRLQRLSSFFPKSHGHHIIDSLCRYLVSKDRWKSTTHPHMEKLWSAKIFLPRQQHV